MNIRSTLEEWKPNVKQLADTLILGPQRHLLERVNTFNNYYKTDINITKTYRWGPGIYNKIRAIMFRMYELDKVKRTKISTISNAHYNSRWRIEHMFKAVQRIESEMVDKRSLHAIFQDNTDTCEKALEYIITKAKEEGNKIKDMIPGMKCEVHIGERDNNLFLILEIDKDPYDLLLFLSSNVHNPYSIPMERTRSFFWFSIGSFITHYSIGIDRDLNEDTMQDFLKGRVSMDTRFHYDRDYGTLHPYINSQNYNNMYVHFTGDVDKDGNYPINDQLAVHTPCFGGFSISTLFTSFKWEELLGLLNEWLIVFTNGRTNPLNNITSTWHGILPNMDETFRNVFNLNPDICNYTRIITNAMGNDNSLPTEDLYCDTYECTFRKNCRFYCDYTGETFEMLTPFDDEVPDGTPVDTEEAMANLRELEDSHGIRRQRLREDLQRRIISRLALHLDMSELPAVSDRLYTLSIGNFFDVYHAIHERAIVDDEDTIVDIDLHHAINLIDRTLTDQELQEEDPEIVVADNNEVQPVSGEENTLRWVVNNGGDAINLANERRQ